MSKEAIEIIKKEAQSGDVEELYLDDVNIGTISVELKKELEKLPKLMCLSMNNCGLTSLTNFPSNTQLIRLELMENKFDGKELSHIGGIKSLQSLSLGSNSINSLKDLEPLKGLEHLIQLDLSDTELAKGQEYRVSVFGLLKNLQVLDNLDVDGNEYEYSGDDDEEEDGDEDDEGEDLDEEDLDEDDLDEDEEGAEDDDEEDDDEEDDEEEDDEEEEEEPAPAANKRKK